MNRWSYTGIGVVSPVGCTHDKFCPALVDGRSGIKEISIVPTERLVTRIAAEFQARRLFHCQTIDEQFLRIWRAQCGPRIRARIDSSCLRTRHHCARAFRAPRIPRYDFGQCLTLRPPVRHCFLQWRIITVLIRASKEPLPRLMTPRPVRV
jgi:hypothetical protein